MNGRETIEMHKTKRGKENGTRRDRIEMASIADVVSFFYRGEKEETEQEKKTLRVFLFLTRPSVHTRTYM
jgi:hypothetical protein